MKRILNNLDDRKREIIKVGSVAAGASIALALLEAIEGVIVGSVTMIIDGLSHVTEAGNAGITVLGTYLAGKPATKKHPFGFGRVEYLTELLVALFVIQAGITGVMEGVKEIADPSHPHITVLSLIIVGISMVTRIVVGRHDIHTGTHYNSRALKQVGKTEVKHAILSAATLVSALTYLILHININGYIATIVSVTIVISGVLLLKNIFSSMLGERMDEQLAIDIKKAIRQEPGIHGVYDLVLHNYGPDSYTGSVHIAVDETLSIDELDRKTRHITDRVKREFDVSLTGVGIYSVNGHDEAVIACRNQVLEIALSEPHVEQVHGFYLNQVEKEIRFDVVVDFEAEDRLAVTERVVNKLKEIYPDFTFQVKTDTDFGMLTGNE